MIELIFEPIVGTDIVTKSLELRKDKRLCYESEIGFMVAINDAMACNSNLFLITKEIECKPIISNFIKIEKRNETHTR